MIVSIDTKEFRAALQLVGRAISAKAPWPVLTHVKITTNDNRITLTGSNGDLTLETEVAAAIDTEGGFCLPFATLYKFISSARSETCKISVENHQAKVSASRNRITLATLDTDDFMVVPPIEADLATLDPHSFCAALKFCMAAAGDDEVRYNIAGVNISQHDDGVHLWGTDGHSAHQAIMVAPNAFPESGATLPRDACTVVLSAIEKSSNVEFMIAENGWHLATKRARSWGKVIDATYPEVQRMLARFAEWSEIVSVEKAVISDAVTVATCGSEADTSKNHNVIFRSSRGENIVMRGMKTLGGVVQAGRSEVKVNAASDFAGGISAKYISAAVAGIESQMVRIEKANMDDSENAGIRISDAQDSATLSMSATIMAMRVSDAEMADV